MQKCDAYHHSIFVQIDKYLYIDVKKKWKKNSNITTERRWVADERKRENGKRCKNGQMNFMFYGLLLLLISVSISYFGWC